MPTPDYHAQLSPSSAMRWINCPASVRLSEDFPTTTSDYAEAGRLAHAIAELKARKRFTPLSKRTYTSQLKKLQDNPRYLPEMDGYTDAYVEALEQHAMTFRSPPFVALEASVPIGAYTAETKPDGSPASGTADCIQIAEGILWITDYKNGSGVPVDADHNPQMMLYALGALRLFAPIYGDTIHTVRMTIVQPALKSVSDYEIARKELESWGDETVRPAAARAIGDDPGEPEPGNWCRFCLCRNVCRTRRDKVLAVEAFGRKLPPLLTNDEVGQALTQAADLVDWYKALADYALQECLAGRSVAGWKAVEGRSAGRKWADTDAAIAKLLADGVDEAMLYERKPITAPAAEKLLGRAVYEDLCAPLVVTPPGKPTLAPVSDKRAAYNAAAVVFKKI